MGQPSKSSGWAELCVEDIPESRRHEISERARRDALQFLEQRIKQNLFSRKIPTFESGNVIQAEILKDSGFLHRLAFAELSISSDLERFFYISEFLLAGGYIT